MPMDAEQQLQAWRHTSKNILTPKDPFPEHQKRHAEVFQNWQHDVLGPPPVWVPTEEEIRQTNLAQFMSSFKEDMLWLHARSGHPQQDLPLLHLVSCQNPEAYWGAVLRQAKLKFHTPPHRILVEDTNPDRCRWLPGGMLNIADCALSSPKSPSPSAPAIIWAADGQPSQLRSLSWQELRTQVHRRAISIAASFSPGDAIAICLPMSAHAIMWYLAIILAGCAVVSIADSFAPDEIALRLRISKAAAVITQDVIRRGGKAHALYTKMVDACAPVIIVLPSQAGEPLAVRLRPGDMTEQAMLAADVQKGTRPLPHLCKSEDVTNILFSSGTTGEPKAITWTHVTPLKCMADAWAHQDVKPGEVVCWPTNMGWMMGPWLVYAALLNGATVAVYEGAPLGADFGAFVQAAKVSMLGLVPSIVKTWRQSDCMKDVDWSCIRCFSSTGEASAPGDYHWLSALGGYKPVIEYCGGTEIGGAYLTGTMLQPQAPSTFSIPTMGTGLTLLTQDGGFSPHASGTPITGEVALVPPLLGSSQRLLNRDHYKTYYEGMPTDPATGKVFRRHGDELQRLPGGYYTALGRCDDTMNLGGIKVASMELERVVTANVAGVAEVAAVGIPTPGGGPELLFLYLVLSSEGQNVDCTSAQLKEACQKAMRKHLNPLFKVCAVEVRSSLPRNTSGKVMRRVLRDEVVRAPKAKL